MTREELITNIRSKQSFLCVGLDTDLDKIPKHLLSTEDPIFEFNRAIIDSTKDYCVAYKLNLAFYEAYGIKGWETLIKTVNYIPSDQFKIADAKRGDIGNTADMYARAFFEKMNFDAITLSPYMGADSIKPFLKHDGKWVIVLGLTSNEGAKDFQMLNMADGRYLHEAVIERTSQWGNVGNTMFVIGATRGEDLKKIRNIIPEHFLLVPGYGAQGGSLEDIATLMNEDIGILVNSSRGIIYADQGDDFAQKAGKEAKAVQQEMAAMMP